MQKIEYGLPVFKDGDIADLNEYSEQMAEAIKVQIDKFGNPIIFKGAVETLDKLEELLEVKNGYVYAVTSENKNYIYNGNEWVEYSDTYDISVLATKSELQEHGVVVSPTQPTTGEKVWLKKGKNLYNKNTKIDGKALNVSDGTTVSYANRSTSDYIEVMQNTDYVISCSGTEMIVNIVEYTEDKSYKQNFIASQFTTSNDTKYIRFYSATDAMETAQLEAGTTVTEYEEYTEPAIYIKNDNGVYEEFMSKEDNLQIYSTAERVIGKWIDGKTLYRKVITTTTPDHITSTETIAALPSGCIIKKIDGYINQNGQNLPLSLYLGESNYYYTYSLNNEVKMKLFNENRMNASCTLILEYTKTTD